MSFLVYINNTGRGDIWRTLLVQYISVICLQNIFSELPPSIDSLSGQWRLVLGQRHCEEVSERGRLNRWTLQVAILWRWSLESGVKSLLSHVHKDNSTAWKKTALNHFTGTADLAQRGCQCRWRLQRNAKVFDLANTFGHYQVHIPGGLLCNMNTVFPLFYF